MISLVRLALLAPPFVLVPVEEGSPPDDCLFHRPGFLDEVFHRVEELGESRVRAELGEEAWRLVITASVEMHRTGATAQVYQRIFSDSDVRRAAQAITSSVRKRIEESSSSRRRTTDGDSPRRRI